MNNKKIILIVSAIIYLLSFNLAYTQESTDTEKKPEKPVRSPFASGILIDNQTVFIPQAKTLELIIHHRFGKIENGISDLLGIYAPSNIRIGLNYSIRDNLMIGVGTTKYNKLQDVQWKWNILEQTRSGSMPIALTYYGNTVIDTRNIETFGKDAGFTSRLSYFHQVIIARKFNDFLSLQIASGYTHFNKVDSLMKNDNVTLYFGGRIKISPLSSIIFEYDQQLTESEHFEPKPNLGLGIEISTDTHTFQIFLDTFDAIINQYNNTYNTNDFTKKGLLLGFNITRLWSY